MNAARWVVVGILTGGSVGFLFGAALGTIGAEHRTNRHWRQLFLELGQDHGHEIAQLTDELVKADATIAQLNKNIGVVYDAGVMAGQTFQADRQEHDL